MAEEPDPFEREIVQNCPANASYYYLVRYNQKKEQIRFPSTQALRIRSPFEYPMDCKPGTWLVIYASDALGNSKVQHIGNRAHVQVELQIPDAVCEGAATDGKSNQELVDLLVRQAGESDDADEGLKTTRIDAKKREIALGVASKEQKVLLRGAMNKETIEAYMLNRFHRTELHAQVDAMFKVQNLSVAMMERTFVLVEKVQEAVGRVAEIEKAGIGANIVAVAFNFGNPYVFNGKSYVPTVICNDPRFKVVNTTNSGFALLTIFGLGANAVVDLNTWQP